LVSNFNDKANVQGTGTTIVQVTPGGKSSVFANIAALPGGQTCPGGIGLTTALGILSGGWVVVGSLPTSHGGVLPGLDPAGCLIVLNDRGAVAETITNPDLVGPWDLTVKSSATSAEVFVSNALGGNITTENVNARHFVNLTWVSRPIEPKVISEEALFAAHWQAHGR